jgi:hypothetical protein
LSFPAYRRISTLICLPSRPGEPVMERVANIDPQELQAAQERDAGVPTLADYHSGYRSPRDGSRASDKSPATLMQISPADRSIGY